MPPKSSPCIHVNLTKQRREQTQPRYTHTLHLTKWDYDSLCLSPFPGPPLTPPSKRKAKRDACVQVSSTPATTLTVEQYGGSNNREEGE